MILKKNIISICMAAASLSAMAVAPTDTIPYGEQRLEAAFGYFKTRDSYTGSQSSVEAEQIGTWQGTSIGPAIRGKLAGWYDGEIRGMSSPNASDALIVLDGVPMPFMTLTELDPTTVGRVTILKDAAAKALYGPQGAQGVMLITTKHGAYNSLKIDISANFALQQRTTEADMLDSYGQAVLRNQALINDGLSAKFSDSEIEAFRNGSGINNDWRKMYERDIFVQKYNVQVGGGSDRVKFYVNAGFARETGKFNATYNDKYNASEYTNRFTIVSNLDVKINSWLRGFANTNIGVKRINAPALSASIWQLMYTTPQLGRGRHARRRLDYHRRRLFQPTVGRS